MDALQCLSGEYGWPDYLCVISTAEQSRGQIQEPLACENECEALTPRFTDVVDEPVVALHTVLTDSERL